MYTRHRISTVSMILDGLTILKMIFVLSGCLGIISAIANFYIGTYYNGVLALLMSIAGYLLGIGASALRSTLIRTRFPFFQ